MIIKILFLAVIVAVACGNADTAEADYKSGNTRYQMLHIKQMAQRDFSNRGRTKYVYTDQTATYDEGSQNEIGTALLERNSTVRELHIGIDWRKNSRIEGKVGAKKITIGKVKGGGRSLKQVNVIVNSNKALRF